MLEWAQDPEDSLQNVGGRVRTDLGNWWLSPCKAVSNLASSSPGFSLAFAVLTPPVCG